LYPEDASNDHREFLKTNKNEHIVSRCRRINPMVKRYFNMVDTGEATEPDMFPKDVQAYTPDVGLMNGISKVLKYVW
jgi:hypothetical protein